MQRRAVLLAAASSALLASGRVGAQTDDPIADRLQQLEADLGGQLGLFALDTANGATLGHRADERFALCSTFKLLAAAAVLRQSASQPGLLDQRIRLQRSDLVAYSPVTEKHLDDGLTLAEMCAAALQYSDNSAGNVLIKTAGGPAAVTAFARTLGDGHFRLDRWETALNTAIPGDERDTSTPTAMGRSLQRLLLGDGLAAPQQTQLRDWLYGNTTGAARIKAGIPVGWKIGDKTGGGDYGVANDVALVWPPQRAPVVIAVYTRQPQQNAKARNDVIAAAARVVVDWLAV